MGNEHEQTFNWPNYPDSALCRQPIGSLAKRRTLLH